MTTAMPRMRSRCCCSTAGTRRFVAYDGRAAIAAAETHRPNVMLLDIGLPGMSGHDVCRQIREQSWGRGIRMIALNRLGTGRRSAQVPGGRLRWPPGEAVDLAAVLQQFQHAPALG
jgi:CheY-like chemotaxis protein